MTRIAVLSVCLVAVHPADAGAQWLVTAFLGDAWNQTAALHVRSAVDGDTDVTLRDVDYQDRSFDFPLYYGVRITRFLRDAPWLGLEGEFLHLKAIADPNQIVRADGRFVGMSVPATVEIGDVLQHFELSHGLNFILANAVVRLPLDNAPVGQVPALSLTGRAGVGPTIPHVEALYRGRVEDAYQLSSLGWQLAGGVEVRLIDRVLAVSEVKWTSTNQRVNIDTDSEIQGSFRSTQLVFGLTYRP